ncbi:hypothetical protein NUU61_000859 [Penicillium alfredii]|uniref:Haloacid dehalogenase-like hydrolase n=1 Tax=Penicillium alfredii TaxID=1506179 RepID=A0A9W9GBQ6_9EURO|nr:uncharacterized protein NUU61_000859 [Penicillium alfredii]KAJ5115100.1 hypothetical protein NUU61_000859 [Penicillium alfredii]
MSAVRSLATVSSSSSSPRTLLLTLDAFGTLFYPRPPIPEQYAAIAHDFGLSRTVTADTLKPAFKEVYRAQAARYPNYGRADVLRQRYGGPRQWWEEVIQGSFSRALISAQPQQTPDKTPSKEDASAHHNNNNNNTLDLPAGMVDVLLDRFAGDGGYALYDDVAPFFARMRQIKSAAAEAPFDRVLLGIISNSDDRVPAVLKALGVRVGDVRADQDLSSMELPGFEERRGGGAGEPIVPAHEQTLVRDLDLDFVITSYEAGEEKPSRKIFDVAKRQAQRLACSSSSAHTSTPASADGPDNWVCVHVGDDYAKDYLAAKDAGWESYLLPRNSGDQHSDARTIHSLLDLAENLIQAGPR